MTTPRNDKGLRFATWNVRTLYQSGKLEQACRILENYDLAFLGMSEVRWNQTGHMKTTDGHQFLWSGMPNEHDSHQYGVGILIHKQFLDMLIDYKFVNERIMTMRLKGKCANINVVQCYAPTEEAKDDQKDKFYDTLNQTLKNVPRKDFKIVMGDFNAKVGSDNSDLEKVMGKHGVGSINDNGERLVEMCGLNELKIGGTLFPHKLNHKITWLSADSKTQNQIDHICVTARWSNCLCDVRSKRGADIGSDHHMLFGKLKLKLPKFSKKTTSSHIKYNVERLNIPQFKSLFCNTLTEKVQNITYETNIDQNWDDLKTAIQDTSLKILGKARKQSDEYISEHTWSMIDERAKMKNNINSIANASKRREARKEYNQFDKMVRRAIRDDKREYTNRLAMSADEAAKTHDMKKLFDITKKFNATNKERSVPIKNENGEMISTTKAQLARWKEHFMETMNIHRSGIELTQADNIVPLPIKTTPPTKAEIRDSIKSLKLNKASGTDNIPAEIFKADPNMFAEILYPLFNEIWVKECYPKEMLKGTIIKVPKKGDRSICDNWRGITVLPAVMKIIMKILLDRMMIHCNKKLRPEQAGFRPAMSCTDQINTLRIIIEQSLEMRSPLYMLFVDYEKAFDSVNRDCIWTEMHNFGVPDKIIRMIRTSYEFFECTVLHDGEFSESFRTTSGVRQGCLLSPLLFLIVLDAVVKRTYDNKPRGIIWDPLNPQLRLESLDYADDKCELSHRIDDIQSKIDDLASESAKVGLKINISKTKEIRINVQSTQPINVGNQVIESVQKFQYLGSMIDTSGGALLDVESRIRKARGSFAQLSKTWRSNEYSTKTKLNIFSACVLSVLLYGCETWLVTEEIKRKIEVFVNRCLRIILRIFWPNTVSNDQLLNMAKMSNINTEIRKRKFGWIGHTLRREDDNICQRALTYNPQGSRGRGRPKNSWRRSTLDEVNNLPEYANRKIQNLTQLKEIADRRSRWRLLIESLCPP